MENIFLELIPMYRLFVAATLPKLGITQNDSWGTQFLVIKLQMGSTENMARGILSLHSAGQSPTHTTCITEFYIL
jgi:hypothetical protein